MIHAIPGGRLRRLSSRAHRHQSRAGRSSRHFGRMDSPAHRDRRTPRRRPRRADFRSGLSRGAAGAGERRDERQRSRSGRAGDGDARQHFSGDCGQSPSPARDDARRRLRRSGGVRGFHLCAVGCRQCAAARPGPDRPRDRGGNVLTHSRLGGSRHLRAVWRRRRRPGAEVGVPTRRPAGGSSSRTICTRTGGSTIFSMSTAAPRRHAPRVSCGCKAARSSVRLFST